MSNDKLNKMDACRHLLPESGGEVWRQRLVRFFIPTWYIREEIMGGILYWMIYRKWMWFDSFYERWNTPLTAASRLSELNSENKVTGTRQRMGTRSRKLAGYMSRDA